MGRSRPGLVGRGRLPPQLGVLALQLLQPERKLRHLLRKPPHILAQVGDLNLGSLREGGGKHEERHPESHHGGADCPTGP